MRKFRLANRTHWLPIAATISAAVALATLLAFGLQRASQLQAAAGALQLASGLGSQPQLLRPELTLVQHGLESTAYVGDSLRTLAATRSANANLLADLARQITAANLAGEEAVATPLAAATNSWRLLDQSLQRIVSYDAAGLYADSASGSVLTVNGQQLQRAINNMLTLQSVEAQRMATSVGALAVALQAVVTRNGNGLRTLLLVSTALASVLVIMMLYFALRARASGAQARNAMNQVENILGTVREGLFLVDRNGRISQTHSTSLLTLLHDERPGGKTIEELLRPLVDEKTLLAAVKYLNLLWKERVNEDLIEAVNPLHQIEVHVAQAHGGSETRYLSFAFRRAREAGNYVFGVVADVTERVRLQQELTELKSGNGAGESLFMQVIGIDPSQLSAFIDSADRAFRACNESLTAPGKDAAALRSKLDRVFRELHAVKGEAAALGLEGLSGAVHAAEEVLTGLRDRHELAGSDFVPVVTHLDGLIGRLAELGEARHKLVGFLRTSGLMAAAPAAAAAAAEAPAAAGSPLGTLLQGLAREVSHACKRDVQLQLSGLEDVPSQYAPRVKDICVQMVRNAIVHGIEPAERRTALGKQPAGVVRVSFADGGSDDYTLLIEDDGGGLSYEQILNRALVLNLVKPQQAVQMDRAAVFRLIFMPGFSTSGKPGEHAGRGVGLDVVNTLVRECGGRIGIATTPGQFTRFKMQLPRAAAHSSAA